MIRESLPLKYVIEKDLKMVRMPCPDDPISITASQHMTT
jgi:hypothetical protein